jgi:hypothetical protein
MKAEYLALVSAVLQRTSRHLKPRRVGSGEDAEVAIGVLEQL